MKNKIIFLFTAFLLTSYNSSLAEESFEELVNRALKLKSEGNIAGALEELNWAKKSLEKIQADKVSSFLPEKFGNYVGGKTESSNAFGVTVNEKTYKDSAGNEIKISITGSGSGEGFGAFVGMAAGMSGFMTNQPGIETIRIKNQRAMYDTNGGTQKITLTVQNSILNIEKTSGSPKKEDLIAAAEAVNIDELSKLPNK